MMNSLPEAASPTHFELVRERCQRTVNGSGWTNREGRGEWDDYERRKWNYDLTEYSL